MHLFPALVLASLPFLVTAVLLEERSRNGLSIPIAKRSGLRNADGVVDIGKVKAGLPFTIVKFQRGFEAFQRNTGATHPSVSELKRRNHDESLTNDNDWAWYGTITVGTPAVNYTVQFDTGSSDTFLPAMGCNSTCYGHKWYFPNASVTSCDIESTFAIMFGDNSTVSGDLYTDTVALAGYKATKQTIGGATTYSKGFQPDIFPADGILGMGYESISGFGASPVFQTLVKQGKVSTPVFSFYFAESDSELYIGGTNRHHYKGSFAYMPVEVQGYWQGSFDNITVNGTTVVNRKSAIIDTGTTQIVGDTKSVQAIYSQIPGSKSIDDGVWTIPCDFNTTVSITFSRREFQISPSTFNIGHAESGFNACVGGIRGVDGFKFWLIGDVFLKNVYTVFDLGNNQVGFASLASS